MTPVDKERKHCSSCDRVITDFSKMSDDELMLFFTHSNGKICGRFARHQLDRPMPLLPKKTQPAKWWRTLLLLPLTLFGKSARAQNDSAMQNVVKDSTAMAVSHDSLAIDSIAVNHLNDSTLITTNPADSLANDSSSVAQSDYLKRKEKSDEVHSMQSVFIEGPVYGDLIITVGNVRCTPEIIELFPKSDMYWQLQAVKPIPGEVTIVAADSAFQNITTENPQTPVDPQAPAQQPASTDLSAVLPEKRRRFRRS